MASTTSVHAPRPTVKRASRTWPGDATARSHFEDFLREIGADPEAEHLCCKGTSPHPHVHSHMHKGSTASMGPKSRSSPTRAHDKARASPEEGSRRLSTASQERRAIPRGRRSPSSSRASSLMSPSLPVAPKSPALSCVDLENHDAAPTYNHLASARDVLLILTGGSPADERPSRAPTRTFFHDRAPASRSPDSASSHSPVFAAGLSTEQHLRPRTHSSPRSASPTPSIDSLDTASSSEAPATPRTHTMLAHELPPSLDDLERASRFRVESRCVRCHRAGSNFPSCSKCGEMWCSRECRLQGQAAAGRTHACHGRSASA
ncbi:hypothetical protein C8Q78DRAFT_974723 [Trametes maxima]|nr:hypothetical protein C8Q78DRAFT_974723 [Trametes maxima]